MMSLLKKKKFFRVQLILNLETPLITRVTKIDFFLTFKGSENRLFSAWIQISRRRIFISSR